MQRTEMVFEVDAHPRRVWRLLHPRPPADAGLPRVVDHPGGRITILAEGDEAQQGLVRTCEFPVPRYLLSGGRGESWEVIVEARLGELSRDQAVGRPAFSRAEGWHRLELLEGDRTRLTFAEQYEIDNRLLRFLLERRVHHAISGDNAAIYEELLGRLGPVRRIR